jgi:hypothetical protein
MDLPRIVMLFGYSGLIPFLLAPAWLTLSPQTAPTWIDAAWLAYAAMIASFMSGTFWGFALPASMGPNGQVGLLISVILMLLSWVALLLPFTPALALLSLVFLLLLAADFWRERVLDTVGGYFALRAGLTVGVLVAIAWRVLLSS